MKGNSWFFATCLIALFTSVSCNESEPIPEETCVNPAFFDEFSSRTFAIGFSTWPYAPTLDAVEDSYSFIRDNSTIYSEHIDINIPWKSWFDDLPLPEAFINEINGRASRKIPELPLTVSVSLLNSSRSELAFDYDGTVPEYASLDDQKIEDAYFKHLKYITEQLNPDFLVMAIEVNELLIHAPEKWEGYKSLMANVRSRIQSAFPTILLSESFTLHNLFDPNVSAPESYISEVVSYANVLDLVSISFYPYFTGLNDTEGFQEAFDFLHQQITKPIAFAETAHLSEDLEVDGFDLFIPGNECEQNSYMEVLLINAQKQNYQYVIWWAHRDYNPLWETFPDDVKDLGALWLSSGIINEDGANKIAFQTWAKILNR